MYNEKYNTSNKKQKDSKKRILLLLLLLLLLIAGGIGIRFFLSGNLVYAKESTIINRDVVHRPLTNKQQTVELKGYGQLNIDEKHPYVYFENSESNPVFLQYEVYDNEEFIYRTPLIAPGDFDSLNVYDLFNDGPAVMTYKITFYDLENRNLTGWGYEQSQEILIIGG